MQKVGRTCLYDNVNIAGLGYAEIIKVEVDLFKYSKHLFEKWDSMNWLQPKIIDNNRRPMVDKRGDPKPKD
jgi:hypothetical protein